MFVSILMMFATAQATDTPMSTPPQAEAMQRLLSGRHAVGCAEIEATSETPQASLVWVVENTKYPAWAGMRAAQCLIDGHALES